ncbi:hypothetical protein OG730_41320 (plasmid) [Streptomyces sp. NBC_01298]|uniref:hypothetical protein n=1 Tax=Streptomyces sp. NBC_01298 TaxID=2903817 RepID=UPI002E1197FE|nr:hypothetical protein OG730_42705 [Streptomyces sp. NBC_01298]WSK25910.1 hypothetical protein OG730_41320 [Streptomyces sp. NBC_01298]
MSPARRKSDSPSPGGIHGTQLMLSAEVEDITAMREERDLGAYMRVLISPAPTEPAPLPTDFRDPSHIPGAWPAPRPPGPGHAQAPGGSAYCGCLQCQVLAEHVESDACACSSCAYEKSQQSAARHAV